MRDWVEDGLRDRRLRAVVCTSSLDLGRRLRAGRPGAADRQSRKASRACCSAPAAAAISRARCRRSPCVPTQALELVEAAAAREAAHERAIEPRAPIDGLARRAGAASRHLRARRRLRPGRAAGRSAHDARLPQPDRRQWQWALDFVVHGGASLNAYPEYRRVVIGDDGIARVPDRQIARRHRTPIGTIVTDASITVQMRNGRTLGTRRGIVHRASARRRLLRVRRPRARVRARARDDRVGEARARRSPRVITRWMGAKMPLSTLLAERTRKLIGDAKPTASTRRPSSSSCGRCSSCSGAGRRCPDEREWLIERISLRDGHYLFFYPFEGRLAHLGLATLFSYRLSQMRAAHVQHHDQRLRLRTAVARAGRVDAARHRHAARGAERRARHPRRAQRRRARTRGSFARSRASRASCSRAIPGQRQSNRQLQASSGLLYDVFAEYDPQQPAARAGGARGAGAPARGAAARSGARAAARQPALSHATRRGRRRSRFR